MNDYQVMQQKLLACEYEIGREIIGQREVVRSVMLSILSGGNVLLEGMPGLGKTRLVNTISHVLNLSFKRIQFTPDLMPGDITGTNIMVKDGDNTVGVASGRVIDYYSNNFMSLGFVAPESAEEGKERRVIWGNHGEKQMEIRATVAKFPYYDGEYRNEKFDVEQIPHIQL